VGFKQNFIFFRISQVKATTNSTVLTCLLIISLRYSCLPLTMLVCKTESLHVKCRSLTQHAAQGIQLQQQQQKGRPEVDIHEVRGAGKSLCMSSCDLRSEKSCI